MSHSPHTTSTAYCLPVLNEFADTLEYIRGQIRQGHRFKDLWGRILRGDSPTPPSMVDCAREIDDQVRLITDIAQVILSAVPGDSDCTSQCPYNPQAHNCADIALLCCEKHRLGAAAVTYLRLLLRHPDDAGGFNADAWDKFCPDEFQLAVLERAKDLYQQALRERQQLKAKLSEIRSE